MAKRGHDMSGRKVAARLVTREVLEEGDPELKQKRPDAWEYLLSHHRDYWTVAFEDKAPAGMSLPSAIFIDVDDETGEATQPRQL